MSHVIIALRISAWRYSTTSVCLSVCLARGLTYITRLREAVIDNQQGTIATPLEKPVEAS